MTVSVLPATPAAFAKAKWEDVAPYFDDLAERPLGPEHIESWLGSWSTLEALVTEAAEAAGLDLKGAEAARGWLEAAEREGAGALDYSAVVATITGHPARG